MSLAVCSRTSVTAEMSAWHGMAWHDMACWLSTPIKGARTRSNPLRFSPWGAAGQTLSSSLHLDRLASSAWRTTLLDGHWPWRSTLLPDGRPMGSHVGRMEGGKFVPCLVGRRTDSTAGRQGRATQGRLGGALHVYLQHANSLTTTSPPQG
jgi:hypothetical protein